MLRTKGEWAAFALAMLAVLAFFYWTSATSGGRLPLPLARASHTDPYNLLLHGMLKGHLYLDVAVDPAMLKAANPYDPAVWIPHGWMTDTSFFQGKYYIYYGVAPLLVFMLPFRLLTGADLAIGPATELATVLSFLALAWLWLRIRRDYFPRTGGSIIFASIVVLGLATGLPSLARRPLMYEFAIAAGCVFAVLGLHCLYAALAARRRVPWMVVAGVFLGLGFGSRPTYLLAMGAPALVLLDFARREGRLAVAIRPGLGFSAGFGVMAAGVLLYNHLRFSSFSDFGYAYLLQDPVADLEHIWNTGYFWFNLRNYFVGTLEWTRYFPFATTGPYPEWPRSFYGVADVYGILQYLPVVWFLPVALVARWIQGAAASERRNAGISFGVPWGMVFLAYLGPGVLLLFFGTAFPRYEVDFLPSLVLAAALGACALDGALASPWAKRAWRGAWIAAAVVSAGVAGIMSIPLQGSMTVQMGNEYYEKVARTLNYPTFLYERARGWHYGPVTWQLTLPAQRPAAREKLVETPNATLLVEYLPDGKVRFGLEGAKGEFALWGDGVEVAAGRAVTLSASFGSLYPLTEHPYYLKHEPSAVCGSAVLVTLDGRAVLSGLRPLKGVNCDYIQIADGRGGAGWFSGAVAAMERNQLSPAEIGASAAAVAAEKPAFPGAIGWLEPAAGAQPASATEHLFLRVIFAAQDRWGVREPLLFTGVKGASDGINVVHYGKGQGRFVFDHHGSLNQEGPILENIGAAGGVHDIEIITPVFSLDRGSGTPAKGTVVVKMDGNEVLRAESDLYPAQLAEAFVGENPFGGPTEKRFVGALLLKRWIERR